jgi:hypothetical protein
MGTAGGGAIEFDSEMVATESMELVFSPAARLTIVRLGRKESSSGYGRETCAINEVFANRNPQVVDRRFKAIRRRVLARRTARRGFLLLVGIAAIGGALLALTFRGKRFCVRSLPSPVT